MRRLAAIPRRVRRAPLRFVASVPALPCAWPAPLAVQGEPPARRNHTFEDILALRGVSDPQLSPDGEWVAYVVTATDLEANAINSDI